MTIMPPHMLNRITVVAILAWTATMGGMAAWDWHTAEQHAKELAKKDARSNFNKDQAFRKWATRHGGVYVPIDERTPPNPGLSHIPERDLVTPSGKKLTLMNPAYMLRQMMEENGDLYGVKGRITSFKLINPNNAPDAWEAAALHRFEKGEREVSEFVDINGQPYLRLMGAMMTESGCLKCHARQGYKVGDVRGGVGVAVSMKPYLDDLRANIRLHSAIYSAIWLAGLGAIAMVIYLLRRRFDEQAIAQAELQQKNLLIVSANTELQRFSEISAHHLQEPARRIASYAERLITQLAGRLDNADERLSLEYIGQQARRQQNLLHDIERYLAAGQPRGEVKTIDVRKSITKILGNLAAQVAAAGAEITLGDLPAARIDAPRSNDMFEVALDNALKFGHSEHPLRITIAGERQGNYVRYSVSDNGPGVEAEYRERVFRVFERLTTSGEGTGIGLAILRRVAESTGGRAWIEETPGGGCCLLFELPAGETP